jgi:hypothetical protein
MDSPLFLVRVWRLAGPGAGPPGAFRASVREAGAENVRLFTDPDDVARFLAASTDDSPAGEPGDGQPR